MKKAYIAGPGVFRDNAAKTAAEERAIVRDAGLEPLHPLDNNSSPVPSAIRLANEAMIIACDCVLADIQSFRGPNMDPGTAYEIGFARALGKPVFLYGAYGTIASRVARAAEADLREFPFIECFGLAENLMITDETHNVYTYLNDAAQVAYAALSLKDSQADSK